MKLNHKKISILISLLFVLLISLAVVSAEEISSSDSDVLTVSEDSDSVNADLEEDLYLESTDIDSNQESNINDEEILQSEVQEVLDVDNGANQEALGQVTNSYSISVKNVSGNENANVSIVAIAKNNNVAVSSGYARFLLWSENNELVDKTVLVENGQGILNIQLPSASKVSALNWLCLAAYYDDYGNYQCNTTFTVQIKRTNNPTTILVGDIVGKMGKKVTLSANVYDTDGLKVNAGTLIFTVNGKSYKVTVKNGKASKVINTPFLGVYTVQVKYNGAGALKPSSAKFKLGADLKVKAKYYTALNVKKGAKKFYKITLTNYYTKKPLTNFKLRFKVKVNKKTWKTYTLKSNSKGIMTWSTKKLAKGTHNVVISSPYKLLKLTMKGKIVVR